MPNMFMASESPRDILTYLAFVPMIGRSFTAAEDTPGGSRAVVLSYGLWKNTFDCDANVVGKAIRLKDVSYTVIGVLPAKAHTPSNVDLWTSLRPDSSEEGGGDNFQPILRLKDGATWQAGRRTVEPAAIADFTFRAKEIPWRPDNLLRGTPSAESCGGQPAGDDPDVGREFCAVR